MLYVIGSYLHTNEGIFYVRSENLPVSPMRSKNQKYIIELVINVLKKYHYTSFFWRGGGGDGEIRLPTYMTALFVAGNL